MSATDPVRSITDETHDHPVLSDLDETLRRLAVLPVAADTPYLTAYLDWRPDQNTPHVRQAATEAANAAAEIVANEEKRSASLESLNADIDAITDAMSTELDPAAQGVLVVSNSGRGVFEFLQLGVPVETQVCAAPIPALKRLAQLVEDYPLHALLQADQDTAILSFVTEDLVSDSVTVRSSLYPRKQAAGGWSQRRFQARADERVQAVAKTVAEETRKALEETGCRRLIIAASDVMEPALMEAFHQSVSEKIIGSIKIDIDAPFNEVLEKARPIGVDFERQREAEQVANLLDAIPSGNGVGGTVDVLNALRNGQVHRLLMTRRYEAAGWIDPEMQVFGIGDIPAEHPAGGDPAAMLPVALEEEMIRQAVVGGAQLEVVKGSVPAAAETEIPDAGQNSPRKDAVQPLDDLGGVGAVLRFAI
ncbi:MAG: Vms1/Ankzf1 family peptidyl-tRNA hydrolase [Thermomicrobiales bacterium]